MNTNLTERNKGMNEGQKDERWETDRQKETNPSPGKKERRKESAKKKIKASLTERKKDRQERMKERRAKRQKDTMIHGVFSFFLFFF